MAAGTFGGDERRPAPQERIKDSIASRGAIQQSVGDHGDWFDGRMAGQEIAFFAAMSNGVGTREFPHVAAVTSVFPKLNIVLVLASSMLEDEHKLVLAPVTAGFFARAARAFRACLFFYSTVQVFRRPS